MYTINAAFAMRQETVTGSLKVGKEADLIVVDTDIFNIDYNDIDKVAFFGCNDNLIVFDYFSFTKILSIWSLSLEPWYTKNSKQKNLFFI